ncbi:hypothetical protein [Tahibacter amnicola]|uniref:Uncharacterized protein n=1 Tax=Tahibacter amnicola TaxID=2976241 RepID=A0ABY6B9H6_9GAMM|nr:hypothetical protein [Tahibacter amnicola]UXI66437.1 hypothetical protein N4264_16995 [Tahibacter amnicola]
MRSTSRRHCFVVFLALCAGAAASPALAVVGESHLFAGIVHEAPYYTPGVTVSFGTPNGQGDAVTDNSRAAMLMPIACTANNLRVSVSSTDLSYANATVTLVRNDTPTALSCTTAGGSCANTATNVLILAGDRISLQISPGLPQRPLTNDDSEIKVKIPFSWRCVE